MSYPWQKFFGAVSCLIGSGDMRSRLKDAAVTLTTLNRDDFPRSLQQEFADLMADLSKVQAIGHDIEGAIARTIDGENEEGLNKLAERILAIYDRVVRLEPSME